MVTINDIRGARAESEARIVLVCAKDVTIRPKQWLWRGHLLRGALELMTGIPGIGKSQVQIGYIACVSAGLPWPDGSKAVSPATVVMLTAEDTLDQEVVPRLLAAQADVSRVHIIKCIKKDRLNRQFLLSEDLMPLENEVRALGNVGLITVDPITAYMGSKMDSHKATEVRSQLGPLKDFAERTDIAISAITHPPKNGGHKAIDHFIGSQAFIAAGRIGHLCVEELDDNDVKTGRILFTNAKNNAHFRMPTLAYRIAVVAVGQGVEGEVIDAPFARWDQDKVNITADEALGRMNSQQKTERGSQQRVQKFLSEYLDAANGIAAAKDIIEKAERIGITEKQLRTARKHLRIRSQQRDDGWYWGWPNVLDDTPF